MIISNVTKLDMHLDESIKRAKPSPFAISAYIILAARLHKFLTLCYLHDHVNILRFA